MPKSGKKLYYWDTSCFIAWLDGGKGHSADALTGLEYIATEINDNRAFLCTSVTTNTEVLQGKYTPEQIAKLENFFKRRNVSVVSVDMKISQRASQIRNYYNQRNVNIKTPDATHLATALIYKVDEFHTLDGDGERKRPSDLLSLNGNVAGEPLHIRVPLAPELPLLKGIGPLENAADTTPTIETEETNIDVELGTPPAVQMEDEKE